jgi:hypothetical protein
MIVPYYDEFGMYTNSDDIETFIKGLMEQGIGEETTIYSRCIEQFGNEFSNLIEYLIYGKD